MHFKDGYRVINGKKKFILGINYLSSSKGHSVNFWRYPDFIEINNDFKHIARLKFEVVRLSLPFDIIDNKGNEDDLITANIEEMVKLADENGLRVVFTFFHTAGFLEDSSTERPVWTKPENFYTSEKSFEFITRYVSILAVKYAHDGRIDAWDVGNEPWWHAGLPPDRPSKKVLNEYSRKIFKLIRNFGVSQPLTFGADHSAIMLELGADIIGIAEDSDFVSTHFYSKYVFDTIKLDSINTFRDTHYGPYILKFSQHKLKPLGTYEFGNSTLQVTEEGQAVYKKILLYSSFVAGAHCMFPWTFCDMNSDVRHIYNELCPQELEFGIVRTDRSEKKSVNEFAGFLKVISKIDLENYAFKKPDTAIYVEKGYYDRLFMNNIIYPNAYMMARAANIPVNFVRFGEELSQYKLLFVPNGILTIEEMDNIKQFVVKGGTVFMSFNKFIHGMAPGYMQDMFGFRQKDFVSLPNPFAVNISEDSVRFEFSNMEPIIREGIMTSFHPYIFFDVEPTSAKVLATDNQNRPVVCINTFGKGKAISCTFPVEQCMAKTDHSFHKTDAYKLYKTAFQLSGLNQPVSHNNKFVETGLMEGKDGSAILFLINHEPSEQNLELFISEKYKLITDFQNGIKIQKEISLKGSEVMVLKLE
jgi:endo-1,4-beta-mannosidase